MSGKFEGVQAQIFREHPLAFRLTECVNAVECCAEAVRFVRLFTIIVRVSLSLFAYGTF
jgi:hypothetical protein